MFQNQNEESPNFVKEKEHFIFITIQNFHFPFPRTLLIDRIMQIHNSNNSTFIRNFFFSMSFLQIYNLINVLFLKDPSLRIGTRLTKSASWFNSLSRRASRKTPIKKRSFAAFSSGNESFTAPCPRLNK